MTLVIEPIPKEVLTDTIGYRSLVGKDKLGVKTYDPAETSPATELTLVRIRKKSERKRTSDDDDIILKAKIWYDVVNSLPAGITPKEGDIFIHGGKTYTAKFISEAKDFNIHHYRVECV